MSATPISGKKFPRGDVQPGMIGSLPNGQEFTAPNALVHIRDDFWIDAGRVLGVKYSSLLSVPTDPASERKHCVLLVYNLAEKLSPAREWFEFPDEASARAAVGDIANRLNRGRFAGVVQPQFPWAVDDEAYRRACANRDEEIRLKEAGKIWSEMSLAELVREAQACQPRPLNAYVGVDLAISGTDRSVFGTRCFDCGEFVPGVMPPHCPHCGPRVTEQRIEEERGTTITRTEIMPECTSMCDEAPAPLRLREAQPPKRRRIYRFKKPTEQGILPAIRAPVDMPGVEVGKFDDGQWRHSKRDDPSFDIVPEFGLIPTFSLNGNGQWVSPQRAGFASEFASESGLSKFAAAIIDNLFPAAEHSGTVSAGGIITSVGIATEIDPFGVGEPVRLKTDPVNQDLQRLMYVESILPEGKVRCRWTKPSGLTEHGEFAREDLEPTE